MHAAQSYIHIDSNFRDKNNFSNPFDFTVLENQVGSWLKLGGCKELETASVKVERLTIPYPRAELFATTFIEVESVAGAVLTATAPHALVAGDIVEVIIQPFTTSPFVYGAQYQVAAPATPDFELIPVGGGASITTALNQTYSGKNRLRFALVRNVAGTVNIQPQMTAALNMLKLPHIYVDFHSKGYTDLDLVDTINGNIRNIKFIMYTDNSLIQKDEYDRPVWIHYSCDTPQILRFKKNDSVVVRLQDRSGRTINVYPELPSDAENLMKQLLLTLSFKW